MTTYHKLESPFGNWWLIPTGTGHIYASAGHNLNDPQEYPVGSRQGPIEVNRVSYAASGHFYVHPDGTWKLGIPGDDSSRLHSLYMSKNNLVHTYKSYNDNQASFPALHKVREVMEPLVTKWASEHADLVAAANRDALQEKCEKFREEIVEHQKAIAEIEAKLRAVQFQLAGDSAA